MTFHRLAFVAAVAAAIGVYAYAFSAEPPYGALRGRVVVSDTQQPLAGISVIVRPQTPRDGADARLRQQPAGAVDAHLHHRAPGDVPRADERAVPARPRLDPPGEGEGRGGRLLRVRPARAVEAGYLPDRGADEDQQRAGLADG